MSHKLFVVGIGPGGADYLTGQAQAALAAAQVLCGYTLYVELIAPLYPEKETYTSGMRQELERCRWALETAQKGKTVALVCSGLSALPPLRVLANAGAAVLGAPLGHDFCVISLSDLLTPWETIEKRLRLATQGEFALCLYNPSSRKRRDYLRTACEIVLAEGRDPDTLCGWVRNIGRPGEAAKLLTLAQLREEQVDMFTTVYIGNSTTREVQGRMVTPRGYRT